MSEPNVKVVQDAYAAFGRGDVAAIVNGLTDDIDWHFLGPKEIPTAGPRKGKPEVQRFFREVAETWSFDRFEPRQFIAQGDTVVCLGFYSGKANGSGRTMTAEWAHVFTIRNGKIAKFREYTDTAAMIQALGAPARA
jgi:uncharacterized protein